MEDFWRRLEESADCIRNHFKVDALPETLVVLGSGFKGFEKSLIDASSLPLHEIPHFPVPKVAGHGCDLVVGRLHGRSIVVLSGRAHMYEGLSAGEIVYPIRSLSTLGVQQVLLTNASGSLHPDYQPGEVVVLRDQINFTGRNCLLENGSDLGEIFIDMSNCFDQALASKVAKRSKLKMGVYVGVLGPTYETLAEVAMFKSVGGHVVGMSTVQEVIAAHQLKMRILGLSFVTNLAGGTPGEKLDHRDVIKLVDDNRERLISLLGDILDQDLA